MDPVMMPDRPTPTKLPGIIELKPGEKISTKTGSLHFVVPKKGGAFYPQAAMQIDCDNEQDWQHYADGVSKQKDNYNKHVKLHNDKIAEVLKLKHDRSWWQFWK